MKDFNPNSASSPDSGLFGLPFTPEDSKIVLIPVPWEVTTSYGGGTSNGPEAILKASRQVDLFDYDVDNPYQAGISMLSEEKKVREWNANGRKLAAKIIEVGGDIGEQKDLRHALDQVNQMGEELNQWLKEETGRWLEKDKIVGVVGGDHSVPFGAFQAFAKAKGEFGILHFDAHSDTRDAFEGFQWSHASIMRNALDRIPEIKKIVQIGIRDFCEEEWDYTQKQENRLEVLFQSQLARRRYQGESFEKIIGVTLSRLPKKVWVSFDIDGLDPKLCPGTGTPVPGGLEFEEAIYTIRLLVESGRTIIGFDLNEVAPSKDNEWDANVGARLLYKLCGFTLASQGLRKLR